MLNAALGDTRRQYAFRQRAKFLEKRKLLDIGPPRISATEVPPPITANSMVRGRCVYIINLEGYEGRVSCFPIPTTCHFSFQNISSIFRHHLRSSLRLVKFTLLFDKRFRRARTIAQAENPKETDKPCQIAQLTPKLNVSRIGIDAFQTHNGSKDALKIAKLGKRNTQQSDIEDLANGLFCQL